MAKVICGRKPRDKYFNFVDLPRFKLRIDIFRKWFCDIHDGEYFCNFQIREISCSRVKEDWMTNHSGHMFERSSRASSEKNYGETPLSSNQTGASVSSGIVGKNPDSQSMTTWIDLQCARFFERGLFFEFQRKGF